MFIDGCFWHYCEEYAHFPKANAALWRRKLLANRSRDIKNESILVAEGRRVIRVWEDDDVHAAVDRVESELESWSAIADRR